MKALFRLPQKLPHWLYHEIAPRVLETECISMLSRYMSGD